MTCMPLSSLLPEFGRALSDEIGAAREAGGQRYELRNGKRLGEVSGGVLYRFQLDRTCSIPDGRPDDGVQVADDGRATLATPQRPAPRRPGPGRRPFPRRTQARARHRHRGGSNRCLIMARSTTLDNTSASSWVQRSRQNYNADLNARGSGLHQSWSQLGAHDGYAGQQTQLSFSAFVADGFRAGIDLRDTPGCLSLYMTATSRFLANALRLLPPNTRLATPDH